MLNECIDFEDYDDNDDAVNRNNDQNNYNINYQYTPYVNDYEGSIVKNDDGNKKTVVITIIINVRIE